MLHLAIDRYDMHVDEIIFRTPKSPDMLLEPLPAALRRLLFVKYLHYFIGFLFPG